jgi:carboxypeptidase Q
MAKIRALIIGALALSAIVVLAAEETVNLAIVHRIKTEAFENSNVMDHMFYLTDVHGPRLTNSPGYRAAADWAAGRLKEYGLVNVKLEKWGPFGRGWSYSKFAAHLLRPAYAPLIGFPLAWTPGTNGPLNGEPVLAVLKKEEDLQKYKGKLKGKIVLIDAPRELPPHMKAQASRYQEADLAALLKAPDPTPKKPPEPDREARRKFANKRNQFLRDEGVLVALTTGYNGDGGTVFATSGGTRDKKDPTPPPMAALTPEHYNRIVRLLDKKIPVQLEIEIQARFYDDSPDSFNVIAEVPGGKKKDELVMMGAHLDSWHAGTGATDNAAGSAVVMEAARVLKALNVTMDRTVRLALWGGEEQGLLGSKAYVKEHFADPETMVLGSEHSKLSAYFNFDNGTGKIRGIYLQGNDMVRPIFEAWLAPFRDLGAATLSIRDTRGTDHLSFDAVGLPGFQFIQDPVEYATRTHHSNMDVYDHIQASDLMEASAIMASFVYHAAMRPEMLPRKPLPKPKPKKKEEKSSQ